MVALLTAGCLLLAGCSGTAVSAGAPRPTASSKAAPTTTAAPLPTTTTPAPRRGLPVNVQQYTFTDSSRPVASGGKTLASSRVLPTTVWMPTNPGTFPLVVFVHGYDVGPSTYGRFCTQLASAGYVVAAPSFPLEDPSRGFGLDRADLPNEATDVSFVITSLAGQGAVSSRLTPGQVAVVGHSDGADVALMVGYVEDHVDRRVRGIVADAPDPIDGTVVTSSVPLLLVQGDADDVVPYSASQTVFGQVRAPRYYLTLLGATHLPPIAGGTEWTPVLDGAADTFLDAEVAGRTAGSGLRAELTSSSLTRLQTAGTG